MSRSYGMSVTVKAFNQNRTEEIKTAASSEWNFDDFTLVEGELYASGDSSLAACESEAEFARRLAKAIFNANQGPCEIQIDAAYLEDPPTETYSFGSDEFDELMNKLEGRAINGNGS